MKNIAWLLLPTVLKLLQVFFRRHQAVCRAWPRTGVVGQCEKKYAQLTRPGWAGVARPEVQY